MGYREIDQINTYVEDKGKGLTNTEKKDNWNDVRLELNISV